MNPLTTNAQYSSTLYDVGTRSPDLRNLLTNCPSALEAADAVLESTGQTALYLRNTILESSYYLDPTKQFSSQTNVNRLAKILIETQFSTAGGVQAELNAYSFDDNPGILSTIGSGVSWLATPITTSLNYGLSFIWSSPEPIDCDSSPAELDRAAFTFCEGAKSFFAERKVIDVLSLNCPGVLQEESSPVKDEHLSNLGKFLVAAERGETKLSFNPANARKNWDSSFKTNFCMENAGSIFCSENSPAHPQNTEQWKSVSLDFVKDRISPPVFEEILQALNPSSPTADETNSDL
ncbi:MAG: hypothetical protein S4CHLAM6_07570 [Chlamydiae bacterium]|nr:hypothetical protein [Chlamydiota bacterium]